MSLSTGIDLVEIAFVERAMKKNPVKFSERVFCESEVLYCETKVERHHHYALRLAAKEALMKAIGTGWSPDVQFRMIEITNNEKGQPHIILHDSALALFTNSGFTTISLSLSRSNSYAMAVVILS